jgi:hypothetical protein
MRPEWSAMIVNHLLHQAMQEAGHTCESLAIAVEVHPKTVGRWVSGGRTPHPRQRVVVAEALHREIFDLWPDERRTPAWLRPWVEIERDAATLRSFQIALVPGLLQTEAYARAVLTAGRRNPDRIDELVAGRMDRQRVLTGNHPPYCTFVVDEMALRRGTPEVMRDQLRRLLDLGDQITLHVVPPAHSFYAGQAGPFSLATVDGRTLGLLEDPGSGRVTEDVEPLIRAWEGVRSMALPGNLTQDMIAKMVSEL